MNKHPVIWSFLGPYVRFALVIYEVVATLFVSLWFVIQVISSRNTLTPAALAFFAGILLVLVVQVLGVLTMTVATENAVIIATDRLAKEIDELRGAVEHLLERLGEVPSSKEAP